MAGKVTTQNVVNTTSNIGAAQLPYYNTAMQGAQGLLTAQTPIYDRDRLEGFTQQQRNLQGQVAGMQAPSQFGQATNLTNQAGLAALNAGNYTAGQYAPTQFTAQQFGNEQAQQYMSPYFQNVLDIQKREAATDAQKSQLMQNLGASRLGTYGGSRQLLAGLARERDLSMQMGDIQAKGLQSAYENAQQQFERDRTAGFDAQKASEQSKQYGADFGERSRQFGARQGLDAANAAGQMGQTLANIGQTQQNADISRFGLQQATAAQDQAFGQQMRDLDYADFQYERDDPYRRLQQYMGLMSGVPQATSTTQTSSAPAPGVAQQILGAGLGALGMYKTLGS